MTRRKPLGPSLDAIGSRIAAAVVGGGDAGHPLFLKSMGASADDHSVRIGRGPCDSMPPRDDTMTRKSRVFFQVEALEPKALLSAALPATMTPGGPATVAVQPLITLGATATTATPPSAGGTPTTVGNPMAPVENALDGTYVHAGRSLSVEAEGIVASLGQVDVSGSITVSGPKSSQDVTGMLTLTGSEGSVTLQLGASKARSVVGNESGPVAVTETVIGATGNGISLQGESERGFLGLGRSVGTRHGKGGGTAAPHGSFWLFVGLNPPAG
jgi:hypothetical protein